jgi:hypothetical protein
LFGKDGKECEEKQKKVLQSTDNFWVMYGMDNLLVYFACSHGAVYRCTETQLRVGVSLETIRTVTALKVYSKRIF